MVLESQQKLVLSVIEFLNQSIQDGTVASDDKEGLEVAGTSESIFWSR
jgi:small glutamine-rich tetratricopeptide repeat-containing protein alpha